MSTDHLADDVIGLLMQLIEIPSFSGEESQTGDCIQNWLHSKGVETQRIQNIAHAGYLLPVFTPCPPPSSVRTRPRRAPRSWV